MKTPTTKLRRWPVVAAFALAAAGCSPNEMVASVSSKSVPYQEYLLDPVTLTTIHTIAVLPFDNRAPTPGFDGEVFAVKLANQLAGHGTFRVIYPQDFLRLAQRQNRAEQRRHDDLNNRRRLGLPLSESELAYLEEEPRPFVDPARNAGEALRLARKLGADAVVTGYATDFEPAMRPRLTVSYTLTATGHSAENARAVAALTMSGIPGGAGGAKEGAIYTRQQVFDAREGNVNNNVRVYTTTHVTDNHPDGYLSYLSTIPNYYDVCAGTLAEALAKAKKDAVKKAEKDAKLVAHRRGADPDEAALRLARRLERDERIPDTETARRDAAYYDRGYPAAERVLARGEDARVRSWRPDGPAVRAPLPAERGYRDGATGPDQTRLAATGYAPDADALLEGSLGSGKDTSWRAPDYNRAHPDKAVALYDTPRRMEHYE